jgi:hypothetical protein
MILSVGTVKGRETRKNRNGDGEVLLLQVEVSDIDDVQTAELMTQDGDEASPEDGALVLLVDVGSAWLIAIAVDDQIKPDIDVGGRRIYSHEGGARKATIYWRTNGQLEINGIGDHAVRFAELEKAFNQLRDDFNNHTGHVVSVLKPAIPSTADISPAKVNTVELPS